MKRTFEKHTADVRDLLQKLVSVRSTNSLGYEYLSSTVVTVLESALELNPAIAESDRHDVLRTAIENCLATARPGLDTLISEVKRCSDNYLASPSKEYVLASGIAISSFDGQARFRLNASSIQVTAALPKKFNLDAIRDRIGHLSPNESAGGTYFLVNVSARTADAAYEKAKFSAD